MSREPWRDSLRRDPRGRLLDALPWCLRRVYVGWRTGRWPWDVPSAVRLIGHRRPPQYVFDYFQRLEDAERFTEYYIANYAKPQPAADSHSESA